MINYILVFFIALSGLFGVLSYKFWGDKAEAESALVQVINANTGLRKSLNLQIKSCGIDNKVVGEYQAEKQVQQDKTQATISKIDSIPKKAQVTPNAEIDIDSELPADLKRMLSESCLPNEGEVCTNAK